MSDNTLTGCWRLEQVGQHSSDEDDLFSSMKSRRSEGTGELEGYLACVSVNMDLLNAFQNIKKLSLKLNTCLPASAACERLFSFAGLPLIVKLARMNSTHLENQLLLKLNKKFVDQGWAIHFPKGPHEVVGLLWRAGPIR